VRHVGLALAALASATLAHEPRRDTVDVPTLTVAKRHFARTVRADGYMLAAVGTHLVVPQFDNFGLPKLASLAGDGTMVKTGDVIVRFDTVEARKRLRDAEFTLAEADENLRELQLKAAANDRSRADAVAAAEEDAAQARVNQDTDEGFNAKNDIIESAMSARVADATLVEAKRAREIDRAVWRTNVELSTIERRTAATAVDHMRAELEHFDIRAPGDGLILLQRNDAGDLPKPGTSLWPDSAIADIPEVARMDAEVFVLEVDSSGLEVGQPVDVVIASRPDAVVHGKIDKIDRIAKPRDQSVPVQYVSATVALDHTDRDVMKIGQRVKATIALGGDDAIVVPRLAVFDHDGKSFVYRRGTNGFEPVDVELGATTLGSVAITRGLADGDVIAERDPRSKP
jgi:HlyD family secretion protein